MRKFIVDRTEIKEAENGMKYIDIFDSEDNNWYEEQKNFQESTLKVMYNKNTLQVSSTSRDVTIIAPTMVGDVVEEIEHEDVGVNPTLHFVKGKLVELKACETIRDGEIVFDRDFKKTTILKELTGLKVEYSEREFVFKERYLQKNRELDKNNLGNIVTMLLVSKQQHFKDWKFKDKEGNDIYVDLTIQDMLQIADTMQKQTTKAMKIESALIEKLETLNDEELKSFNAREEYEALWNA